MKKNLLSLLILFISVGLFSAPNMEYDVNESFKVLDESDNEIIVEFNLPEYDISDMNVKGQKFTLIDSKNQTYTTKTGYPMLPKYGTGIAVPYQGKVKAEVLSQDFDMLSLGEIYPSQEEGFVTNPENFINKNYERFFPVNNLESSEPFIVRDLRVSPLVINPFQYNEAKKVLKVTRSVKVKLTIDSNVQGFNEMEQPQKFSSAFFNLYESTILNFDRDSMQRNAQDNANILVIHKESSDTQFNQKLEQYFKFKLQKGYNLKIADTGEIGSTSATGIKNYIAGLYDGQVFRPDYVILLGDVSGTLGIPTHNPNYADSAEGDYPYSFLAGDDFAGDVFIGRMSIDNSGDLARYYGKMRSFELLTNSSNDDYLSRMLLVGDTDPSGESTVNNCKFVKQTASRIYPDYEYTEIYNDSPNPALMNQAINMGVGIYVYRGYIGMSSWNPGSSQVNIDKLNHAVINTCATGNFASTATTEAYMNMGTEAAPKGGVTAIGMATASTHTSFNNSLTGGIFHGIMNHHQRTMGEALLTGKLTTYIVYKDSDMDDVKKFTHWCNLIGDPTVDIYVGKAGYLEAENTGLYDDSNQLSFIIKDSQGRLVSDANVSLTTVAGEIVNTTSNNSGIATFTLNTVESVYQLTANKADYHPLQETINVDTASPIRISEVIIDDDAEGQSTGNGNGILEAGEEVELNFVMENLTPDVMSNVAIDISSINSKVEVLSNSTTITEIQGNSTSGLTENLLISLGSDLIEGELIAFYLNAGLGDENYNLIKTFQVSGNNIHLIDTDVTLTGVSFESNETATISATIKNMHPNTVTSANAYLQLDNGYFNVDTESIAIADLAQNSTQTLDFIISTDIDNIPGMTANAKLIIDNQTNIYFEDNFEVTFGTATADSPMGPDAFGYVIYDSNDTNYAQAPTYEWIEISSSLGGSGELLDITDSEASGEGDGVGANSTETVDLPFIFKYYGEDYDKITVCSNGFISMGENSNGEFRNYRLPGALGPNGMIAAFWDDMQIGSNSGIYTYYDSVEDVFIIEWDRMVNGNISHNDEETFQIILYNPQRYATAMNQAPIKIQYKVFNNVDNGNPGSYTPWHGNYATVGIESPDGSDGLEYTYNNQYALSASTITNEFALYITTKEMELVQPALLLQDTNIIDQNNNGVLEAGESVDISLGIVNRAVIALEDVTASITCNNPNVNIVNGSSVYNNLEQNELHYNHAFFSIELSEDVEVGDVVNLDVLVEGNDNFRTHFEVVLEVQGSDFIINDIYINDYSETGNCNNIPEAGETINLVVEFTNTSSIDASIDDFVILSNDPDLVIEDMLLADKRVAAHKTRQYIIPAQISATAAANQAFTVDISLDTATGSIQEEYEFILNQSGFEYDFESDNEMELNGAWSVGISNQYGSHSAQHILAVSHSGDYQNHLDDIAWTEEISVNGSTMLSFWHRYDFESNYDGGQLVVKVVGNNTYQAITPQGGYNNPSVSALGGPGYSGSSSSSWTQVDVDLASQYEGQTVKLGFRAASDFTVTANGWFIDDIAITGTTIDSYLVEGNITLVGGENSVNNVYVETEDYMTYPDVDGNFKLVLPYGEYDVTNSLAGYSTKVSTVSELTSNTLQSITEELTYLEKADNLTKEENSELITLSWDYTDDIDDVLTNFQILRKYYTGDWEVKGTTENTTYVDTILVNGDYQYKVVAVYGQDMSHDSNIIAFTFENGVDNENDIHPVIVNSLSKNYPNPFNPETTINFSINEPGKVELNVYNIKGQLVKTLVNDFRSSGSHSVVWHGKNNNNKSVASGVYFYRIKTDNYTKTHKAILMK